MEKNIEVREIDLNKSWIKWLLKQRIYNSFTLLNQRIHIVSCYYLNRQELFLNGMDEMVY